MGKSEKQRFSLEQEKRFQMSKGRGRGRGRRWGGTFRLSDVIGRPRRRRGR